MDLSSTVLRGEPSPAFWVGGAAGPAPPPHPRPQGQVGVSICAGKGRPRCASRHDRSEGAEAGTHSPAQGTAFQGPWGRLRPFLPRARRVPGGPRLVPGRFTPALPRALIPPRWGREPSLHPGPAVGPAYYFKLVFLRKFATHFR